MICHRDIKPENLLVVDRQTTKSLKLADFGLAVAVREPLFTVCGTPTYVGNLFNINNFSDNGSGYNSRSGSGRDNCADRSSRDNSADRSGGRFGDNNPANGGRFRSRLGITAR